jgi:hypothetical protein
VIRVFYKWRVEPNVQAGFRQWWHDGTLRIRTEHPGALGSTLLENQEDPDLFVGVARWTTVEALMLFREKVGTLRFDGAELISIDLLDELDDLTIPGNPSAPQSEH